MGRHPVSYVVLRSRPKRRPFRPRRLSANDRVRDQRLGDAEWEIDKLKRAAQMQREAEWTHEVHRARVVGLEQEHRVTGAQVALNSEKILGLEAREVAGWTAKEKRMHFDLTNQNAEEIWVLRHRVDAMEWDVPLVLAILRKLIVALARERRRNA